MREPVFNRMFGYDVSVLPNAHLASLERDVTNIEEAKAQTGYTIGYPGWGLIYHLLLSHLDRKKEEIVIETGTNQGCTTIILAQALVDAGVKGHVHTFELQEENVAKAQVNLQQGGLSDHVTLHKGDIRETFARELAGKSGIRFAFLDASHLRADVMFEFETIQPHLSDDALVLFDNTYRIAEEGEDQRVNGALKDLLASGSGSLINLEHVSWFTPGLAIWQRAPAL